jgi:hypothetical protein
MKIKFLRLLKILFFILTGYTIIATSRGRNSIVKAWGVVSTCSSIVANNELITADDTGLISSPADRTFLDYGLPTPGVRIGIDATVSADYNGITRSCIYSTDLDGNSGKTLSIYSCTDNTIPSCMVTFTPM